MQHHFPESRLLIFEFLSSCQAFRIILGLLGARAEGLKVKNRRAHRYFAFYLISPVDTPP